MRNIFLQIIKHTFQRKCEHNFILTNEPFSAISKAYFFPFFSYFGKNHFFEPVSTVSDSGNNLHIFVNIHKKMSQPKF
jgi:hypothetical protein